MRRFAAALLASELFRPYCNAPDPQTRLEAIIALGETGTPEAVALLAFILDDHHSPYFVRSAAAWSLGRIANHAATTRLIRAFADVDRDIREEALEGIVSIGGPAIPLLLEGLRGTDADIAAGCAESLRKQPGFSTEMLTRLLPDLRDNSASTWTAWLLGHLPRERVATAIADVQRDSPQLHFAVSVLWCFVESWIARRWEVFPNPQCEAFPHV